LPLKTLSKANITIASSNESSGEDIPFSLVLRPPLGRPRDEMGIGVRYLTGYVPGDAGDPYRVPADLASACLKLAAGT
jgi:hypothetical protein